MSDLKKTRKKLKEMGLVTRISHRGDGEYYNCTEVATFFENLTAENERLRGIMQSEALLNTSLHRENEKLKRIVEVLELVADKYGNPENWDYYDSVKEGSDIPENLSTPWNAVFQPDEDDSELLDGYGIIYGPAYVNGRTARQAKEKVKRIRKEPTMTDPRDELIEKYEDALKEIMGWLMRVFENPNHDLVTHIKNTLAHGAERMEEG